MTLNERVLAMKDDLLACLQENLRIPSVEGTPEEGAPYGIACRDSLDHVLKAAQDLGFRKRDTEDDMFDLEITEKVGKKLLGKIIDVLDYPGNSVYVIRGEHEYMIPAVKQFILNTDMDANRMDVQIIEGMRTDEN